VIVMALVAALVQRLAVAAEAERAVEAVAGPAEVEAVALIVPEAEVVALTVLDLDLDRTTRPTTLTSPSRLSRLSIPTTTTTAATRPVPTPLSLLIPPSLLTPLPVLWALSLQSNPEANRVMTIMRSPPIIT